MGRQIINAINTLLDRSAGDGALVRIVCGENDLSLDADDRLRRWDTT